MILYFHFYLYIQFFTIFICPRAFRNINRIAFTSVKCQNADLDFSPIRIFIQQVKQAPNI